MGRKKKERSALRRVRKDALNNLVRGNSPFSPFSDVPWAFIVSVVLWGIDGLTSRSAFKDAVAPVTVSRLNLALAWLFFALAFVYYAYKVAENITLTIAPEKWWVMKYLTPHMIWDEVRTTENLSPLSFMDTLSLFFSFPFVFSMLLYATQETWPGSYSAMPLEQAGFARLLRFVAIAIYLQFGVGYSSVTAMQFSGDIVGGFVAICGGFISLTFFGAALGTIVTNESFLERMGLLHESDSV